MKKLDSPRESPGVAGRVQLYQHRRERQVLWIEIQFAKTNQLVVNHFEPSGSPPIIGGRIIEIISRSTQRVRQRKQILPVGNAAKIESAIRFDRSAPDVLALPAPPPPFPTSTTNSI